MKRFKKILVSIDANRFELPPPSLRKAVQLARETGASLLIVDVVRGLPDYVRRMIDPKAITEESVIEERLAGLKKLCAGFEEITHTIKVTCGSPVVDLVNLVVSEGCDLLLRDVADESNATNFGPLDTRLMRHCPCPVWLVKPRETPKFERILGAVDPLPETEKDEQLNRKIVDLASSIAEWENGSLYVIAGWQVRGEQLLASRMRTAAFEDHVDEIAWIARRRLQDALFGCKHRPIESHIKLRVGNAAQVVRAYADEIDADLVVMGTLARTGIPGLLIGNTAQQLLQQLKCSVLTAKADSFIPPLAAGDEIMEQSTTAMAIL